MKIKKLSFLSILLLSISLRVFSQSVDSYVLFDSHLLTEESVLWEPSSYASLFQGPLTAESRSQMYEKNGKFNFSRLIYNKEDGETLLGMRLQIDPEYSFIPAGREFKIKYFDRGSEVLEPGSRVETYILFPFAVNSNSEGFDDYMKLWEKDSYEKQFLLDNDRANYDLMKYKGHKIKINVEFINRTFSDNWVMCALLSELDQESVPDSGDGLYSYPFGHMESMGVDWLKLSSVIDLSEYAGSELFFRGLLLYSTDISESVLDEILYFRRITIEIVE